MKAFKLFTASALALSLFVATVACCCMATGVMAHVHKSAAMCCDKQSPSHEDSSNPSSTCLNHLTSAELAHAQMVLHAPASVVFAHAVSIGTYHAQSLAAFPQIYPRGSPPLSTNFVPLYLRTFTLRI